MINLKQLEELKAKGLIRGYEETGIAKKPNKAKYGNKKVQIGEYTFDSIKESKRYLELRFRLFSHEITGLELQKEFELIVEGQKVAVYVADFVYYENRELVVEDVKSAITRKLPVYRLKKKLMKSCYGIIIKEI